jgi:hypothetical protein
MDPVSFFPKSFSDELEGVCGKNWEKGGGEEKGKKSGTHSYNESKHLEP